MARQPSKRGSTGAAQTAGGERAPSDGGEAKPIQPTLLAPDPFVAVLPAIAALGAITSISGVLWKQEEPAAPRRGSRRRPEVILRDLESCCTGLRKIFHRLATNPKIFAGEGGAAAAPLKFGVHGPRITQDEARMFLQLTNDVASMLVLASQNAIDIMAVIEQGELEPAEEIFHALGEEQERLNLLIQGRATLKATVEVGRGAAERLAGLIRQLSQSLAESDDQRLSQRKPSR